MFKNEQSNNIGETDSSLENLQYFLETKQEFIDDKLKRKIDKLNVLKKELSDITLESIYKIIKDTTGKEFSGDASINIVLRFIELEIMYLDKKFDMTKVKNVECDEIFQQTILIKIQTNLQRIYEVIILEKIIEEERKDLISSITMDNILEIMNMD